MCDLYELEDLTPFEKFQFEVKTSKHIKDHENSTCRLWTGRVDRYGYGVFTIRFRGRNYHLSAHKIMYFILSGYTIINRNLHVSHVCHNKLCVNFFHLSLESSQINHSRNKCKRNKHCHGHGTYVDCVFQ